MEVTRELSFRAARVAPKRGRTMAEISYDAVYRGDAKEYVDVTVTNRQKSLAEINEAQGLFQQALAKLEQVKIREEEELKTSISMKRRMEDAD